MAAADANVLEFTNWADLELIELFARLSVDWQTLLSQFSSEIEVGHDNAIVLSRQFSEIEIASATDVTAATLGHWDYHFDTLKGAARNIHESLERLPVLWNDRCGNEQINRLVRATTTRVLNRYLPFRVGPAPSPIMAPVALTAGISTNGGATSVAALRQPTPDFQNGADTDYGPAATIGSAVGTAVGGEIFGTALGAIAGGGVIGTAVVVIISVFDYSSQVARLGEYDRNTSEAQARVLARRDDIERISRLSGLSYCRNWIGSVRAEMGPATFTQWRASLEILQSQISALEVRRSMLPENIRSQYALHLERLPERLRQWEHEYLGNVRNFMSRMIDLEVPADQYIRTRMEPALDRLQKSEMAAEAESIWTFNGANVLWSETRLWDLIIDGDIQFRLNPGWSLHERVSHSPEVTSTWSSWIEELRNRVEPSGGTTLGRYSK